MQEVCQLQKKQQKGEKKKRGSLTENKRRGIMIKNIVFDMGKVLIYYESMRACRHFIDNEADQKAVCAAVFDSPEWVLLDMGVISEEEGFRKMCARLPERLLGCSQHLRSCSQKWPLFPRRGSARLRQGGRVTRLPQFLQSAPAPVRARVALRAWASPA